MGHTRKTEEAPEKQLWEQLDKVRAGMLGIEGSHSHMQPMAHQADKDGEARLWFFTSRTSDLFRELSGGAHAHFCVTGKDQDYHACLMGDLHENRDRGKIEEYWNDHVAAWWPTKNDPDIALLVFDLLDAAIDDAIARKPKGHDFVIDRRHQRPALSRHMSVTGG
jgi:general stress protein 26